MDEKEIWPLHCKGNVNGLLQISPAGIFMKFFLLQGYIVYSRESIRRRVQPLLGW